MPPADRGGIRSSIVATHYEAAIALYRSCGWRNAGEVTLVFGDGTELQSHVYVAPRRPEP